MTFALVLHALAAVIWVGGMSLAVLCVRPAAAILPVELRAALWLGTFQRFFPMVIASIAVLLGSGLFMVFWLGGLGDVGPAVHVMITLGIVMMLIFGHVYFSPYAGLKSAVARSDWPAAGQAMGTLRKLITLNLVLGVLTTAAGAVSSFSSGFE